MPKYRNAEYCVINSDNVLTNSIIVTTVNDTALGLLWGCDANFGNMGFYFVTKGDLLKIKASDYLSEIKDTANKLNIYFEDGFLKFQNKIGAALYLYVKFEGLTE